MPARAVGRARRQAEEALRRGAPQEALNALPAVLALYHGTPLRATVEALFATGEQRRRGAGRGRALLPAPSPLHSLGGAQVARREVGEACVEGTLDAPARWDQHWHIDGCWFHEPEGTRHVPRGEVRHFDALVGVCLTEGANEPFRGNLVTWPGAHALIAQHMERADLLRRLKAEGVAALPKPHELGAALAPATQVCLRPGDAVVLNYLSPHSVAPHCGGSGQRHRLMVYFRVSSRAWAGNGELSRAALVDPWHHWVGLRERGELAAVEQASMASLCDPVAQLVGPSAVRLAEEQAEAAALAAALEASRLDAEAGALAAPHGAAVGAAAATEAVALAQALEDSEVEARKAQAVAEADDLQLKVALQASLADASARATPAGGLLPPRLAAQLQ